jgi:hypothetical protein
VLFKYGDESAGSGATDLVSLPCYIPYVTT